MEIPDRMVDAQVDNMLQDTARRMQSQGLSMDLYMKYTGMNVDQMKDQLRPDAVKRIQTRLVLEAVAKAENIEVSEEKIWTRRSQRWRSLTRWKLTNLRAI